MPFAFLLSSVPSFAFVFVLVPHICASAALGGKYLYFK